MPKKPGSLCVITMLYFLKSTRYCMRNPRLDTKTPIAVQSTANDVKNTKSLAIVVICTTLKELPCNIRYLMISLACDIGLALAMSCNQTGIEAVGRSALLAKSRGSPIVLLIAARVSNFETLIASATNSRRRPTASNVSAAKTPRISSTPKLELKTSPLVERVPARLI